MAGEPLAGAGGVGGYGGSGGFGGAGGTAVIADGGDLSDRVMPHDGTCKAGYYEGAFSGLYVSQVLNSATMGLYTNIPIAGDIKFNIEQEPGSAGESFAVSEGQFAGTGMSMFPFFAEFYGELDCNALRFEGELKKGYYEIGADKFAFQGMARSLYDPASFAFDDGVWSVAEPVGSAPFESPSDPDAGYPPDKEFPAPIEVQPGVPPNTQFPVGFEGGAGEWNAILISETPQPF